MSPQVKEALWTALLYILASPIFALRAAVRYIFAPSGEGALDRGTIACSTCGEVIVLSRMNQCGTCGFVSASSLVLPCEACGDAPAPYASCDACGATNEVPL